MSTTSLDSEVLEFGLERLVIDRRQLDIGWTIFMGKENYVMIRDQLRFASEFVLER